MSYDLIRIINFCNDIFKIKPFNFKRIAMDDEMPEFSDFPKLISNFWNKNYRKNSMSISYKHVKEINVRITAMRNRNVIKFTYSFQNIFYSIVKFGNKLIHSGFLYVVGSLSAIIVLNSITELIVMSKHSNSVLISLINSCSIIYVFSVLFNVFNKSGLCFQRYYVNSYTNNIF
jgi:hypothetical protein